jgi:hypothetical protein
MNRWATIALAIGLCAGCFDDLDGDDDDMTEPDPEWTDLLDRRDQALIDLGEPVLDCVTRADAEHPAFHGCVDWHSAVHGTWALHALARLVGDEAYLDAADDVLDPEEVADELADLEANAVGWEIPYGVSWFLALARERDLAGRDDLRPLGEVVAADLESWFDDRSDTTLQAAILNDNYGNASWALLNLHEWADHVGDDPLVERLGGLAVRLWLPMEGCSVALEEDYTTQFFPPCLHRMMALQALLPVGPDRDRWLADLSAEGVPSLTPVDDPATAHGAGLNFSRAWGLWSLWTATDDPAWRSLYVEHIVTHLDRPEYWGEDYLAHSHWIPQFGIRALSLSFD